MYTNVQNMMIMSPGMCEYVGLVCLCVCVYGGEQREGLIKTIGTRLRWDCAFVGIAPQ
jgi:hypothetical protein